MIMAVLLKIILIFFFNTVTYLEEPSFHSMKEETNGKALMVERFYQFTDWSDPKQNTKPYEPNVVNY